MTLVIVALFIALGALLFTGTGTMTLVKMILWLKFYHVRIVHEDRGKVLHIYDATGLLEAWPYAWYTPHEMLSYAWQLPRANI